MRIKLPLEQLILPAPSPTDSRGTETETVTEAETETETETEELSKEGTLCAHVTEICTHVHTGTHECVHRATTARQKGEKRPS